MIRNSMLNQLLVQMPMRSSCFHKLKCRRPSLPITRIRLHAGRDQSVCALLTLVLSLTAVGCGEAKEAESAWRSDSLRAVVRAQLHGIHPLSSLATGYSWPFTIDLQESLTTYPDREYATWLHGPFFGTVFDVYRAHGGEVRAAIWTENAMLDYHLTLTVPRQLVSEVRAGLEGCAVVFTISATRRLPIGFWLDAEVEPDEEGWGGYAWRDAVMDDVLEVAGDLKRIVCVEDRDRLPLFILRGEWE
jgi:hypothetical protein